MRADLSGFAAIEHQYCVPYDPHWQLAAPMYVLGSKVRINGQMLCSHRFQLSRGLKFFLSKKQRCVMLEFAQSVEINKHVLAAPRLRTLHSHFGRG